MNGPVLPPQEADDNNDNNGPDSSAVAGEAVVPSPPDTPQRWRLHELLFHNKFAEGMEYLSSLSPAAAIPQLFHQSSGNGHSLHRLCHSPLVPLSLLRLIISISRGDPEGRNLAAVPSSRKSLPLHLAVSFGTRFEVARVLISEYPPALLLKNTAGKTPLFYAPFLTCPKSLQLYTKCRAAVLANDNHELLRLCGSSAYLLRQISRPRVTVLLCFRKLRELAEGRGGRDMWETSLGKRKSTRKRAKKEGRRLNGMLAYESYWGSGRDPWTNILQFL